MRLTKAHHTLRQQAAAKSFLSVIHMLACRKGKCTGCRKLGMSAW
jgi:hypothetical protein